MSGLKESLRGGRAGRGIVSLPAIYPSLKNPLKAIDIDMLSLSNPDNSPDSKRLGGTGFPACAKNTLLFRVI